MCGPIPIVSLGVASYFATFINDATWKVWFYPLWKKTDVLDAFKKFLAFVQNQSSKKLKCFCFDNGGEYTSHEFKNFYELHGIKWELTTLENPSQSGVTEKMNRITDFR